MSDSTWSFSQTFFTQFPGSCRELDARIGKAVSSASVSEELLEELSAELARLTKSLADATGSLPSYDQRQYEEQLKALERSLLDLRGKSRPNPKFAFKRKPPVVPSTSPTAQASANLSGPAVHGSTTNLSLSSRSHQYLTLESLPKSTSHEGLSIEDLDHCLVNLISPPQPEYINEESASRLDISALHVRNLTNTVLLVPPIHGSVLIHDLTRCTIVIGCHQFRMHTSQNVDVYLSITSKPVIEHSTDIHFGGYPDVLTPSPLVKPSNHLSVMDFSHIRSTPSPHWSSLGDDRVSRHWPLPATVEQEVLKDILERTLPQ
ncbi:putative tubulin binding cofactor C [Lyophyllum shimeji]|uniref:Tubulin binding cofactor C n=1 Tax=Lyophyllum shimeji TaxID=47721 RepID=A0A9P3UNN7_LYOSH|nr:putative tubulin binding cofactor C [Lyophyllum shimeji]